MKKNYTYDAKSGRLTSSRYGRVIRGKKRDKKGYLCVLCRLGNRQVFVRLHHAVWAVCKGRFPEQQIDHINGNKHDNRIENLREVSASENRMNVLHPWNRMRRQDFRGCINKEAAFGLKSGSTTITSATAIWRFTI